MKTITISVEEHTNLIVSKAWLEAIVNTFYKGATLINGKLMMTDFEAERDLAALVKLYDPDLYAEKLADQKYFESWMEEKNKSLEELIND